MKYLITVFVFALIIIGALTKNVRILGGEDVEITTYPFMAAFRYLDYNYVYCSGAIISNKHVLTAAQTVLYQSMDMEYARVYTGTVSTDTHLGTAHEIDQVFVHPRYTADQNREEIFLHDIAVVKLKDVIEFNEFQRPIELLNKDVIGNEYGFVLGWGTTSYPLRTYPIKLQKANMQIIPERLYGIYNNFIMHDTQFGALNSRGVGICLGDTGDPFIVDGKLAGLASFSRPCAIGSPDVYTKIYYYIDFITDMMNH